MDNFLFKKILEESISPIVIADDMGNYLWVNESLSRLLGYSKQELETMNVQHLLPEHEEAVARQYQKFVHQGKETGEIVLLSKDGSPKTIQYEAFRLHENINLSFISDITELKMVEKVLRDKAIKLEKMNHAKSTLFKVIGHDLRTPIAQIQELSQMISNHERVTEDDHLRQCLDFIDQAAQNLSSLLGNLLSWAQATTTHQLAKPVIFNFSTFLKSLCSQLSPQAEVKGIHFSWSIEPDISLTADTQQIASAIRNIFSNAVKFTPPEGSIHLQCFKNEDNISLSIRDSGIGMSKKQVRYLFDLAKMKKKRGTNGELGTGLGLNMSKLFIEESKGTLSVESVLGKGSTFKIKFPQST